MPSISTSVINNSTLGCMVDWSHELWLLPRSNFLPSGRSEAEFVSELVCAGTCSVYKAHHSGKMTALE